MPNPLAQLSSDPLPLTLPKGLILDFGGVIVESQTPAGWNEKVADEIFEILGGKFVTRERIALDVLAGETAAKLWRDAMSRPAHPRELTHEGYVLDFIAADWPSEAQQILRSFAPRICYLVSDTQAVRTLRDGIAEVLAWCHEVGIPVAIASNALSGEVHRDFLERAGLSRFVRAEIYSDEAGVRKPNPELLWRAADGIEVGIGECWYVGDRLVRDVLAGVRAGAGKTVLTPVPGAPERPYDVQVEADIVVDDPVGLLELMKDLVRRR
ncbi:MAG: HAD family hydrolase [Trueperella sp.]|nr:HAD family hydrolase [Trueperella sp.]